MHLLSACRQLCLFKASFPRRQVVYLLIISTLFIPAQVTIIPMYLVFSNVHLINTFLSVILAYEAKFLPEAILLMTSTFKGIPVEVIEAAELDGAGIFPPSATHSSPWAAGHHLVRHLLLHVSGTICSRPWSCCRTCASGPSWWRWRR
jgi:ABC-type sugar transport system permease subunit